MEHNAEPAYFVATAAEDDHRQQSKYPVTSFNNAVFCRIALLSDGMDVYCMVVVHKIFSCVDDLVHPLYI